MKSFALLACLALPLAARAQQAPPTDREGLTNTIEAWRTRLPHVDPPAPVTAEFEPRLDAIAEAVKTAQTDAGLSRAREDFMKWQHDLVLRDFRTRTAAGGMTLNQFSERQRALLDGFARQRAEVAASIRKAEAGTDGDGRSFYDGQTESGADGAEAGAPGAARTSPVNAAAATARLRIVETPPPPPAKSAFSLASLKDWFDRSGISDAAILSVEKMKNEVAGFGRLLSGFAGSCYYGAKWLLIKAHALPPEVAAPEEIGEIGIGSGRAYMMSAALKRSPKLQKRLKVRRLDLRTVKDGEASLIPERTMLVFDRGCAGMSAESGHIELVMAREKLAILPASAFYRAGSRARKYKPSVASNEVLACSDGCAVRTMAYLRAYARRGCLNAYVPVAGRGEPAEDAAATPAPAGAVIGI